MFILLQKNYYEYMIKYHLTGNKSIVMISFIWSHSNVDALAKSIQSLCEERSDEAICFNFSKSPVLRLLRFARNDSICEGINF